MLTPSIFKANDIRGLVAGESPQWDAAGARAIGAAFAEVFALRGRSFVLGRDMRASGVALGAAFAEGALSMGADVIDIGLASTDQLWFASGHYDVPGVQLTASHNPAGYNGVKFCQAMAAPIEPAMLQEIARLAMSPQRPTPVRTPGNTSRVDVLPDYAAHLHALVDLTGIRRLKVVYDAGNGMAGHTAPAVLAPLNLELIGLFTELDGSFPNHPPNPLEPENLADARRAVIDRDADVALVFDGDADRCFIIDEHGEVVSPSLVTALIAQQELRVDPGGVIVINTITSRAVNRVVAEAGGRVVVSKVGHTSVKALMAEHDAIFGGEHSAHYYFRDFWGADTGMLAAMHVLAALGEQERPLGELAAEYERYASSGEINTRVGDQAAKIAEVKAAFPDAEVDELDGLTLQFADGSWANLRPSNTEPLLRLNVEGSTEERMAELRDAVLSRVRA